MPAALIRAAGEPGGESRGGGARATPDGGNVTEAARLLGINLKTLTEFVSALAAEAPAGEANEPGRVLHFPERRTVFGLPSLSPSSVATLGSPRDSPAAFLFHSATARSAPLDSAVPCLVTHCRAMRCRHWW